MQEKYNAFSIKIRILHMVLFEVFGLVIFTPLAAFVLHRDLEHVGIVGVLMSVMAMFWNFVYNWLFDIAEFKLGGSRFQRSVLIRCLHALLFELGLLVVTVPLVSYFLDMTVIQAFLIDIGFVFFFLIYAFIFNWVFDQCYLSLKGK